MKEGKSRDFLSGFAKDVVQGAIRIFVFDKDPSSPSHLHIYKIITVENGLSRK